MGKGGELVCLYFKKKSLRQTKTPYFSQCILCITSHKGPQIESLTINNVIWVTAVNI